MNVEIHEKEFGSLNFLSRDITNKFWKNNTDNMEITTSDAYPNGEGGV